MPIMPTIVGFRGGDAVVPSSVGWFGGIGRELANGFLKALRIVMPALSATIRVEKAP